MSWSERARAVIARVHAALPGDASLDDRKAAIDAAYPFGVRAHFPYKAWCKARRAYLVKYGYRPRGYVAPTLPFADFPRDPATGRPVIG